MNNQKDTLHFHQHANTKTVEFNGYIENEWSVSPSIVIRMGLNYLYTKTQTKNYGCLNPRLAATWTMSKNISLKASFTKISQAMHRISSSYLDLPSDAWIPTTLYFAPSRSFQYVLGLYGIYNNPFTFSIEGFIKKSNNLLCYKSWNGLFPSATDWASQITNGIGRAYGIDIDVQKAFKNSSLSISYTLSWSKRYMPEIWKDWYYDQFDNRHRIFISYTWKPKSTIDIFAHFVLHSGNRTTIPIGYTIQPPIPTQQSPNDVLFLYSKPNNISLPLYHRLDIGLNFNRKNKYGKEYIWNISLYNVYCHLNTIYIKLKKQTNGSYNATCQGYIPIIPSFSYTLKF